MECPTSVESNIDPESLQLIGENAIRYLNDFALRDDNYLPALNRLCAGVDQKILSRVLEHGTPDNLRKCLKKASAHDDGASRCSPESGADGKSKSESYLKKEAEATDFLVLNTKQNKDQRLVTRESIPQLYAKYSGSAKNGVLCYDTFEKIYHELRVLRDRHCETSIYSCVLCDDQFAIAKKLMEILDPDSSDYEECKIIYDRLVEHKEKQHIQRDYFQRLWHHPPDDSVIIAEDAGKRFVNEGKGVVHVMMVRWRENLDIHEHHYFFCIQGNESPTVSRYSIAQSWLTFRSLDVLKDTVKKIYVFHDGGTNEYANSSGLLLYASLQRLWNISFTVICFVAYHGKGLWDGLIGNAATIMSNRAVLIKIVPELHFDQLFYYRSFVSIKGKAEQSKAFGINVNFDHEWSAKTLPGITNARKFEFNTTQSESTVRFYELATSVSPFQELALRLEETEEEKRRLKQLKDEEKARKRAEKQLEKERKQTERREKKDNEVLSKKKTDVDERSLSDDDPQVQLEVTVTNSRGSRKRKAPGRLINEID